MTHCKLIWNGFFVLLRLRFSSKMATTISVRVLLRFEKNKRFSFKSQLRFDTLDRAAELKQWLTHFFAIRVSLCKALKKQV